jgi:cytochrome P450
VTDRAPAYPFRPTAPLQPPSELARLRATEPISRVTLPSGDTAWVVTRYEDVRLALTDPRFSRQLRRPDAARLTKDGGFGDFDSNPVAKAISEGAGHTRWRKLLIAALTPERVERLRGRLQEIADELLDAAETQPDPLDLVQALGVPLPMRTLCELLGSPDEDVRPLWTWTETMLSLSPAGAERILTARREMRDYTQALIEANRRGATDNLVTALIAARDDEGGWLSDDEIAFTIQTLIVAGWGATAAHLSGALWMLLAHPDQMASVRRDPELAVPATEEALRFFGGLCASLGLPRYVTEDVELGGTIVRAGSTVLLVTHSANRDERQFSHPDRFDISRDDNRHVTFSGGPRYCLGAPLARIQIQVAIRTLLRRYPAIRLAVPATEIRISHVMAAQGPEKVPVLRRGAARAPSPSGGEGTCT